MILATDRVKEVYNPEVSKNRSNICSSCNTVFEVYSSRGVKPRLCINCRKGKPKVKVLRRDDIVDFIRTPGNAIVCFKSGYMLIISGEKKVSSDDIYRGIKEILNGSER